jgi:cold shock protein
MRINGTVKFLDISRGFGFLNDGDDVFMHVSAVPVGVVLSDGDKVTFEVVDGQRGPKAVNVELSK